MGWHSKAGRHFWASQLKIAVPSGSVHSLCTRAHRLRCLRASTFHPVSPLISPRAAHRRVQCFTHTVGLTAGQGCARQISEPGLLQPAHSGPLANHRPAFSPVLIQRCHPGQPLQGHCPSLDGAGPQPGPPGPELPALASSQPIPSTSTRLLKTPRHSHTQDVPVSKGSAFSEETEKQTQSRRQ